VNFRFSLESPRGHCSRLCPCTFKEFELPRRETRRKKQSVCVAVDSSLCVEWRTAACVPGFKGRIGRSSLWCGFKLCKRARLAANGYQLFACIFPARISGLGSMKST
jgi:hypothetical protein